MASTTVTTTSMDAVSSISMMMSSMNANGASDSGDSIRVVSHMWSEPVELSFRSEDRVSDLKLQLQEKTGVSPDKVALYLGSKKVKDMQLVRHLLLPPGQYLTCSSDLSGGSLESLYPDGCYDCFCNYGERCGGIFMWRFMLLPAYINCPYDCAFFCLRFQCCGKAKAQEAGTNPDGKPKMKRVEATSNTGIFY